MQVATVYISHVPRWSEGHDTPGSLATRDGMEVVRTRVVERVSQSSASVQYTTVQKDVGKTRGDIEGLFVSPRSRLLDEQLLLRQLQLEMEWNQS